MHLHHLPVSQCVRDNASLFRRAIADNSAVDLDRDTLVEGNGGLGAHAKLDQQFGEVGHIDVASRDQALVRKMVQQTTGRSIRSVDGAKETPTLG